MARLKSKKEMGKRTVVELTIEGGVYAGANGLIHHNCNECKKLHLMDDMTTPRVWKLSDLGHGYHKRGEESPKVNGLHPACRCTLTMLTPGFGFSDQGKIKWVKLEHDEHAAQESLEEKPTEDQ